MKAHAFHVKGTGYYGFVVHDGTQQGLFWAIDEFVDPFSVEVCPIKNCIGVCFKYSEKGDESFAKEKELSERVFMIPDMKFKDPNFDVDVVYAVLYGEQK